MQKDGDKEGANNHRDEGNDGGKPGVAEFLIEINRQEAQAEYHRYIGCQNEGGQYCADFVFKQISRQEDHNNRHQHQPLATVDNQ